MRRSAACIAAALLAAAPPALAARLRGTATLSGDSVTVADLWDDAGTDAGRVLGPGPEPGGRITVEAAQLAAIARQFGVDWRPASAADRATLDRPGRPLPRAPVLAAIRAAALAAGAAEDADIELIGYVPPLVSTSGDIAIEVEQLDYDAPSGRFAASFAARVDGGPAFRQRVVGRAQQMVELPTLARRVAPGAALDPGDLRLARLPAASIKGEPVETLAEAVGMALRRPVVPGQPIDRTELTRPVMVAKGARVTMELQAPGLALSTIGLAIGSGSLGERIEVMNLASRAVVLAEITSTGRVRVLPASLPVRSATEGQYANLQSSSRVQ